MSTPLPPTADVIEEAIARTVEEEGRFTGDLRSFGQHLATVGRAASPAPWSGLVIADGLLCQLAIASPEEAARWGSNLVPNHIMDGTASPPHVTDALQPYLEQRADRTGRGSNLHTTVSLSSPALTQAHGGTGGTRVPPVSFAVSLAAGGA